MVIVTFDNGFCYRSLLSWPSTRDSDTGHGYRDLR